MTIIADGSYLLEMPSVQNSGNQSITTGLQTKTLSAQSIVTTNLVVADLAVCGSVTAPTYDLSTGGVITIDGPLTLGNGIVLPISSGGTGTTLSTGTGIPALSFSPTFNTPVRISNASIKKIDGNNPLIFARAFITFDGGGGWSGFGFSSMTWSPTVRGQCTLAFTGIIGNGTTILPVAIWNIGEAIQMNTPETSRKSYPIPKETITTSTTLTLSNTTATAYALSWFNNGDLVSGNGAYPNNTSLVVY